MQAAGEQQLWLALAQRQNASIAGAATGLLGQACHHAELARQAQALGCRDAAGAQHNVCSRAASHARHDNAGQGHRATLQPSLAAKQPRLPRLNCKALVTEVDGAARRRQPWRLGQHLDIVARQHDTALHAGAPGVGQRQREAKLVVGIAADHRARQCVPGKGCQGRAIHRAQGLGQWPAGLRIDAQHTDGVQVGEHRISAADLQAWRTCHPGAQPVELELITLDQQCAIELGQPWPGQRPGRLQAARCIGVVDILQIGADAELALCWIDKRKFLRVALEANFDGSGAACRDRLAQITAGLRQAGWQVTVHPAALGAAQRGLQVKQPGRLRLAGTACPGRGFPFDLRLALQVGIAETQLGQLHRQALTGDLPAHFGEQLRQRHPWLSERARQLNGAIL